MRSKVKIGRIGEEKAIEYLKQNGYRIIARNFRNRLGEIDIIAKEKDVVCFVEVRSRQGFLQHQQAFESVGFRKQDRLSRLALSFLKKNRWFNKPARFDVVSVSLSGALDSCILLRDAFTVAERFR